MEFENGFPPDDPYAAEYVDHGDLSPDVSPDEWEWEQKQIARIQEEQEVEDLLFEMMANWYDQQKEANLVNWGAESLDDVDHDQ
jgi:hypothetical protein